MKKNLRKKHRIPGESPAANPRAGVALLLAVVFIALCMIGLTLGTAPSSASPNVPAVTGYQVTLSPSVVKALADQDVRPVIEIATTSSTKNADAVFHRTSAQAEISRVICLSWPRKTCT